MPRKNKMPKATNPGIKTLQLCIDGEIIERCNGWQNVIMALSGYIYNEKPSGSIVECFKKFREYYIQWLDHMVKQDPSFKLPMAEGEEFTKSCGELDDDQLEQFMAENYKVDQKFIDAGYFVQDTSIGVRPDGSIGEINKVKVTQKGLEWLKKNFGKGKDEICL